MATSSTIAESGVPQACRSLALYEYRTERKTYRPTRPSYRPTRGSYRLIRKNVRKQQNYFDVWGFLFIFAALSERNYRFGKITIQKTIQHENFKTT
jgi:hypothetical protein